MQEQFTTAQHTPGPWRIGAYGGIVADTPIEGGLQGTDATAFYGAHLICETVAPCNQPLIAAAPALLAALERLILPVNVRGTSVTGDVTLVVSGEDLEQASAAIAAAKGESS